MSAPSHPLQRIAPGGAEALFRLFQLYYYEGSDWADEDIGPDGLFDASPAQIADYINDPAKGAYWIRKDGALAGFVVTEPFTLPNGSVAEEVADLFILKRYRRQGLAFEAVHALARTFTGPWLVAIFRDDTRAGAFWQRLFASLPPYSVRSYEDPNLPDLLQHAINDTDSQAPSTTSRT